MRLDLFLTKNGFSESRNKAAALINDGSVIVNGKRITKTSFNVQDSDIVEIISNQKMYVARSAAKLLTAIDKFGLSFKDKTVVDLGASTGGFCEVMLENGAKRIYAVDIGTNQLHPKIKNDPRVVNKENTNARYVTAADFDSEIDIITCDLSFISLKNILGSAMCTLKQGGEFICLIKPQFEAGPGNIGKNGVVKDTSIHIKVIRDISEYAFSIGFEICDIVFSGLAGESGNREFLMYLKKSDTPVNLPSEKIINAVLGK